EVDRFLGAQRLAEEAGDVAADRGPLRGEEDDAPIAKLPERGGAAHLAAVIEADAGRKARVHQRGEALQRLGPFLAVELGGGEDARAAIVVPPLAPRPQPGGHRHALDARPLRAEPERVLA